MECQRDFPDATVLKVINISISNLFLNEGCQLLTIKCGIKNISKLCFFVNEPSNLGEIKLKENRVVHKTRDLKSNTRKVKITDMCNTACVQTHKNGQCGKWPDLFSKWCPLACNLCYPYVTQ